MNIYYRATILFIVLLHSAVYAGPQEIWEGESVNKSVSGGLADTQQHTGLGWSNGAQLFWRNANIGHQLIMRVDVQASGEYELTANFTKASDYGRFDVYLNNTLIKEDIDLYSPDVITEKVALGTYFFNSQRSELKFVVKNANASAHPGNMLGIDYIQLAATTRPGGAGQTFEGENSQVAPSQGIVSNQLASIFGWSGNQQLWWRNGSVGAVLDFPVEINAANNYRVNLNVTRAGDYGIFRILLDGQELDSNLDLYSASVTTSVVSFENIFLTPGNHTLSFQIVGKNPVASPGYMLGLDYVQVVPIVEQTEFDVTMESLLSEMVDRDRLAQRPVFPFRQMQSTSYSRLQQIPTPSSLWAPTGPNIAIDNQDGNQFNSHGFLRTELVGSRLEYVLMEHQGACALEHIWIPINPDGEGVLNEAVIRFYFDGSAIPEVAVNYFDLIEGQEFVPSPFAFISHDTPTYYRKGANLYFPFPCESGLKVTIDRPPFYYYINYRAYENSVSVKSFSLADFEQADTLIEEHGQTLIEGNDTDVPPTQSATGTINQFESLSVQLPVGSNAVELLEVELPASTTPQMLRSLVLKMETDGEERVWSPVAQFFGTGYRLSNVEDWNRTVNDNGEMVSRWVMPYELSGSISLENFGEFPVLATINLVTKPWDWDAESMHFYARWRRSDIYTGLQSGQLPEWNAIELTGTGVYVGDTLTVHAEDVLWWGEGDERIYIDKPRDYSIQPTANADHLGTGTEDYYGSAWGFPGYLNSPFISLPSRDQRGGLGAASGSNQQGYTTISRMRLLDEIPFDSSFILDFEVLSQNTNEFLEYSMTTFFYGQPGMIHNRTADYTSVQRDVIPSINSVPVHRYEGERLLDANSVFQGNATFQEIHGSNWSNRSQLFWNNNFPGNELNLNFRIDRTGVYSLAPALTTAGDYGIFQFSVNGTELGSSIDTYNPSLSAKSETLGQIALSAGVHELKIRTIGKNSLSGGYAFGLDFIDINRLGDSSGEPSLQVPDNLFIEATAVLSAVDLGEATAFDSEDGVLIPVADNVGPFPLGVNQINWSVSDSEGNTVTDTQQVTVVDSTPPTLTVPQNIIVQSDFPLAVDLGLPSATDIFQFSIVNNGPTTFPIGTTSVTWVATDVNGNSSQSEQTVTVEPLTPNPPESVFIEGENTNPVVTGGQRGNQSFSQFGWSNNAQLFWIDPSIGDNLIIELGNQPGAFEVSMNFTKAPDYGRFNIYISGQLARNVDFYDPSIATEEVSFGPFVLTANASIRFESIGAHPSAIPRRILGLDYLDLNAQEDSSGEPSLQVPDNLFIEATAVLSAVDLGEATAFDSEDGVLIPVADNVGPFPLGVNQINWSVSDSEGNTVTDTQQVTVVDSTPPTLTVPQNIIVQSDFPLAVDLGSPSATDIFQFSIVNNGPTTFPIGTTSVTWVATDVNGNSSQSEQTVTVEPSTPNPPESVFIEGENTNPVVTGGQRGNQSFSQFGWSNNAQLFWIDPSIGDNLIIELGNQPGAFEISMNFTKAPDYGRFNIYINGQLARNVDFYDPSIVTEEINLGSVILPANTSIRFETIGAHPSAIPRRILGLDYVSLVAI